MYQAHASLAQKPCKVKKLVILNLIQDIRSRFISMQFQLKDNPAPFKTHTLVCVLTERKNNKVVCDDTGNEFWV
jgi:hypothetical protein